MPALCCAKKPAAEETSSDNIKGVTGPGLPRGINLGDMGPVLSRCCGIPAARVAWVMISF